jgi:Tol biopolymer transport system component
MSTDRWQRLDQIFVDALQRPPEARAAFVMEVCAADAALRQEVQSLLAAADASGEFMAATAFERLAQDVGRHGYTFTPGEEVGAYTVSSLLGAGSSGEVWRARDTRLGRDVAIKVLLPHLSTDAARVERFAGEAGLVGALNHPNILAVYDVGNYRGAPFLVSEYLDGQTLRARLQGGGMRVSDVVTTGAAIARGLAAAHARGIVHRDLKPENVFIARDGVVKILDFGIAKLQRSSEGAGTAQGTVTGAIVGTAGYMAPEQVRGEEIDARADLFALGVMLHEMLAGAAPFKRDSVFETLQAILTSDPADIGELNREVSDTLAAVIMRLLRKEPAARFQDALDLVWALEQADTRAGIRRDRAVAARRSSWHAGRIGAALAASAAVAVLAALWFFIGRESASPAGEMAVTRFTWTLPAGIELASAPAVSPDGRHVAFAGSDGAGRRLYLRSLDAFDAIAIDGSDGARQPFWSPDSRWIGFFARGRVLKVSIGGGAPVTIADDRQAGVGNRRTERGGTWGRNAAIVYGANFNPPSLFMVPATGGTPAPATRIETRRGEYLHRFPVFLPDGRHFLYQSRGSTAEARGIFLGAVGGPDGETVRILPIDSNAVYVPAAGADPGVLLYMANGRIEAQRFDPARRALVGTARPLPIDTGGGDAMFYPAPVGASSHVLAYSTQLASGLQLKVANADGGAPTVLHDRQEQQWPRISPDGTRMAWLVIDPLEPNADVWVEDLARRTRTRVTTAPTRDLGHVWSPDGRRLAYRPDVEDGKRLSIIAADGSGVSQDLACPTELCEPTDWSSDGRELIVNAYEPGGTDIWAVAIATGGTSRPLVQTRFNERDARLSPDRRWLAYMTDEAGRPEVSLRSLDGSPRRYTVSTGGGDQVVWQRDGRGLYYVDPRGRLRKVSVRDTGAGGLVLANPVDLPVTIGSGHSNTQYDVAPDGRIYYLDPTPPRQPTEIRIVLGWQRLLQ